MWEGDLCLLIVYLLVPAGFTTIVVVETRRFRKARHWSTTSGKVLASGSQVKTDLPGTADSAVVNVPKIEYEYEVAGKKYRGSKSRSAEEAKPPGAGSHPRKISGRRRGDRDLDPAHPHAAVLETEMPALFSRSLAASC